MMRSAVHRYLSHDEASVSMEFVIIWPLLVLWLIASYVFFDVYRSESKAAKAVYTVADILSRQEEVNEPLLEDLDVLVDELIPRASDQKWMRVSSIVYDGTDYLVDWSHAMNPILNGDPDQNLVEELANGDIPVDIMPTLADTDSIIFVELNVPYSPIVSDIGLTDQTWEPRAIVRPRYIARIAKTD